MNRNQPEPTLGWLESVSAFPRRYAGTTQTPKYSEPLVVLQSESINVSGTSFDFRPIPFSATAHGFRTGLVRHREDEHPVIGLIHDDGKIRELVDSNTKLR
jgi:hypothetical protein